MYICIYVYIYIHYIYITDLFNERKMEHLKYIYIYIQGVPGGMCQTSGGCSLC